MKIFLNLTNKNEKNIEYQMFSLLRYIQSKFKLIKNHEKNIEYKIFSLLRYIQSEFKLIKNQINNIRYMNKYF